MKNNANPWQWYLKSFLWIYMIFTGIIAWVAHAGLDKGSKHASLVIKTMIGSIGGPLAGAIARDYQPCCVQHSQSLMKMALPALLIGLAICTVTPNRRIERTVWVISWIVWFFFGLLSVFIAIE